jgi:hypothetical protein
MRNAIVMFASTLLAVMVAFAGYWFILHRPQQEAMDAQLRRLSDEQEQIRRTLSESQDSLAAANDKSSLRIREDLHVVDSMRVVIAEYFASSGKMPSSQAEAGLPPPEKYRGKTLKSAAMRPDGTIELAFDAQSGMDGGTIRFVPDISRADAMGIQWRCETNDYPLIRRAAPMCEYSKAGVAAGTVPDNR